MGLLVKACDAGRQVHTLGAPTRNAALGGKRRVARATSIE
jgi:hypothetical protein